MEYAGCGIFVYTLRYYMQKVISDGNAGADRVCMGEVEVALRVARRCPDCGTRPEAGVAARWRTRGNVCVLVFAAAGLRVHRKKLRARKGEGRTGPGGI